MKRISTLIAGLGLALAGIAFGNERYLRDCAIRLGLAAFLVVAISVGAIDPAVAGTTIMLIGMAGNAPFPIIPEYTAIAMAYNNRSVIADSVLPRSPVGKKEFVYYVASQADAYTLPDTKVSRRSSPNQVEFSASSTPGFCQDYGLDDTIPQDDIDNAPPNFDPQGARRCALTNLILLDREVRVANLVFNTASYAAGLTSTLAGVTQWSDYTNSDPVAAIMNALDTRADPSERRRLRPRDLHEAAHAPEGRAGGARRGEHRRRPGRGRGLPPGDRGSPRARRGAGGRELLQHGEEGPDASRYARAWGKHASFLYRDRTALSGGKTVTFGYTAQFRSRHRGLVAR
jgi:hypothetical protein